jgi:hypothetical protein
MIIGLYLALIELANYIPVCISMLSLFFLLNCRYHFKIRKFYFQGALAIAREVPSESYHYLVDAFPTLRIPQHGSETSAAFVLNIDNQFSRPFRAFKVKRIRIRMRFLLLPIKVPQGANNLIQWLKWLEAYKDTCKKKRKHI